MRLSFTDNGIVVSHQHLRATLASAEEAFELLEEGGPRWQPESDQVLDRVRSQIGVGVPRTQAGASQDHP